MQSLHSISASFAALDWKFVKWGNQYLPRFPTTEGLGTSIPCRDRKASFSVYGWMGNENVFVHRFPTLAWISVYGLLLQNWNRADPNKLVVKFGHIIEVSEDTIKLMDLQVAMLLIGWESTRSIPIEMQAVIGILIKVTVQTTSPHPPMGLHSQDSHPR